MTLAKSLFCAFLLFFLHHQVTGAGVSQCYFCLNDDCNNNVVVENCNDVGEGDYSCLSMYDPGSGDEEIVQVRGCVSDADDDLIQACAVVDAMENASCTICQENLCNNGQFKKSLGAKLCYSCDGLCDDAQEIQQCPEGFDHVCLSVKAEEDFGFGKTKGCLPKTKEFLAVCKTINEIEQGACQVCQEDLCNI